MRFTPFRTFTLAALACLGASAAAQQEASRQGQGGDTIVEVSRSDPEMNAAIRRSRAELPIFYRRLASHDAGDTAFMVKFDILPGEGAEYVWATDLDRAGTPMTGLLLNQPERAQFQVGERVRIPEEGIIDWSYMRGGVMQGAYTHRLIVDRMPPEQAARYRREYGWDR